MKLSIPSALAYLRTGFKPLAAQKKSIIHLVQKLTKHEELTYQTECLLIKVSKSFRYKQTSILAMAIACMLVFQSCSSETSSEITSTEKKPRVIITSDGEIDDECSMVRCLLYANEWDIEAIVTTSSQYHWQGHDWAGDHWIEPYLKAYKEIYPNLIKHDASYPSPSYLYDRYRMGNISAEGEMEEVTEGSQLIAEVLLDDTDDSEIWIQAWGGINTIARALKTIEEEHPEKMEDVAKKMRFYFIFEQDSTYQSYILPKWGKYQIPTIISDQFEALAYRWKRIQPKENQEYFEAPWIKENILENHGPLCSLYKAHNGEDTTYLVGDFRAEGDSPAFLHTVPTGLRSMESPDFGGWGGRFVKIRDNTWMDPAPYDGYVHPEGRYYKTTVWGRKVLNEGDSYITNPNLLSFFKPMWRWSVAQQNDFAARADWSVKSFEEANHAPIVKLEHNNDLTAKPGAEVKLSALGTTDPDGDTLYYNWWQYDEADTYQGNVDIINSKQAKASLTIPQNAKAGETIHVICEVSDSGNPTLTKYARIVITAN
ncbi:nucleoside hydrolase-like domain-containing protein [uncultured Arcticibacterium sp.]|uniref:DUF1593 domain-containing protein n=1 Tax=uncultured Arcticibacterium sp. TaxID=2173042 RepID=UPI0030F75870